MTEKYDTTLGVVLCGGQSRRMGQDKSGLVFGQHSLLDTATSLLSRSGLIDVVVSGGSAADAIHDKRSGQGPLGGIMSVAAERTDVSGLLVVPVDMPSLTPQEIKSLLSYGLVNQRACYFAQQYLPLYLPMSETIRTQLRDFLKNGRRAIRDFLSTIEAHPLPIVQPEHFQNINRPEDWREFLVSGSAHGANQRYTI